MPCGVRRGGPNGAASRVCRGVFPLSARGGLGPWGIAQRLHEGTAENTEDLVYEGCVRSLGFLLSADGGQQLSAKRQRPDLVDRENKAQVSSSERLRRLLVLGDDLQLLSAVQVEPPHRRPVLGLRPAVLSLPPEAVEDMPRVRAAGFTRHDGRKGVWRLVLGQGAGAFRQGCPRREHGVDGFQVPVALLQVRGDSHLVVVATFQQRSWRWCLGYLHVVGVLRVPSPLLAGIAPPCSSGCSPCRGLSCFPLSARHL